MKIEPIEVSVKMVPTMRDQFAMAALTGRLSNEFDAASQAGEVADWCYYFADAMLKAREVTPQ